MTKRVAVYSEKYSKHISTLCRANVNAPSVCVCLCFFLIIGYMIFSLSNTVEIPRALAWWINFTSKLFHYRRAPGRHATRQERCISNPRALVEPSVRRPRTQRLPSTANSCNSSSSSWTGWARRRLDRHIDRNIVHP